MDRDEYNQAILEVAGLEFSGEFETTDAAGKAAQEAHDAISFGEDEAADIAIDKLRAAMLELWADDQDTLLDRLPEVVAARDSGRGGLFAPCAECGLSYEGHDEEDAVENHDLLEEHRYAGWTENAQIGVATTTGEPVTDPIRVVEILADLFSCAGYDRGQVKDEGDGVWLADVPAALWAQAQEDEGTLLTHSGGFVVTIETA